MEIPYDSIPSVFERVVITYHGEGDEGYVEDVYGEPAIEGVELSDDLRSELEDIVYDMLPGGWEINEGSQGTVTIFRKERKAVLHHGENRIETDYTDTEMT